MLISIDCFDPNFFYCFDQYAKKNLNMRLNNNKKTSIF